jgi:wyosine [tRNA(Phe)-imidazoG37] synthetase (radical SAM superfamily)
MRPSASAESAAPTCVPGGRSVEGGSDMTGGAIFGPVPSRRLGRSLGVDVVPYKTCSYDCIYCQLGPTTHKTTLRMCYVSTTAVLQALEESLSAGLEADYITFSGSGEPTLNLCLGRMIRAAKSMTDIPIAVLTNGSLLWHQGVAAQVAEADLVVPSLDAARPETFSRLNRPYHGLTVESVIEGLTRFADAFRGALWVEVMVVAGVNDSAEEVAALRDALGPIKAERVQLNTVVRPPTDPAARPVSASVLAEIREAFGPRAEIIAPATIATSEAPTVRAIERRIRECLARRPCTIVDLAQSLSLHPNEVSKHVQRMVEAAAITVVSHDGRTFFRCLPDGPPPAANPSSQTTRSGSCLDSPA